jgi:hypothetical protein
MSKRRRTSRPVGETLGGMMVGFDYQIMRSTPPPHELVEKAAPVRGLSGEDGGSIDIILPYPGPPATRTPDAEGARRDGSGGSIADSDHLLARDPDEPGGS